MSGKNYPGRFGKHFLDDEVEIDESDLEPKSIPSHRDRWYPEPLFEGFLRALREDQPRETRPFRTIIITPDVRQAVERELKRIEEFREFEDPRERGFNQYLQGYLRALQSDGYLPLRTIVSAGNIMFIEWLKQSRG